MKALAWTIALIAMAYFGYRYYGAAPKPQTAVTREIRETKGTLMTKTRDHEALWIHYSYKDAGGVEHEMSEKVPYSDLWEKLKEGQEIEILYDGQGLSVLKAVATKSPPPGMKME